MHMQFMYQALPLRRQGNLLTLLHCQCPSFEEFFFCLELCICRPPLQGIQWTAPEMNKNNCKYIACHTSNKALGVGLQADTREISKCVFIFLSCNLPWLQYTLLHLKQFAQVTQGIQGNAFNLVIRLFMSLTNCNRLPLKVHFLFTEWENVL